MKKIAFHINSLAIGGAERVVTNLAAQFVAEGYEVVIATQWQEENEYVPDKKVRRVPVGLEKNEEGKGRIAKLLLRFDVLQNGFKPGCCFQERLVLCFKPKDRGTFFLRLQGKGL